MTHHHTRTYFRHSIANAVRTYKTKTSWLWSASELNLTYILSFIAGTSDFFGLNHYTTQLGTPSTDFNSQPSFRTDIGIYTEQSDSWPASASSWLRVSLRVVKTSSIKQISVLQSMKHLAYSSIIQDVPQ
jgi:hypothetical protein